MMETETQAGQHPPHIIGMERERLQVVVIRARGMILQAGQHPLMVGLCMNLGIPLETLI